MRRFVIVAFVIVALLGGCLRTAGDFRCAADVDCASAGARCEQGYCGFVDPSCPSGVRFGEHSGPMSNECVVAMIDAGIDAPMTLGPWSTPVELAALSTSDDESDPSLTGDALEIFFYSDRPGGDGGADLYRATRMDTQLAFGTVQRVAELASAANEFSPEISSDGLRIYFTSDRSGSYEVYTSTRPNRTSMFDTPPMLEPQLSSAANDFTVGISSDALVAIVGQSTMSIGRELFVHTRSTTGASWSNGTRLVELGTNSDEVGATLDATGRTVVFHSDRGAMTSRFDLWTASRASTTAAFGAPATITELNTTTDSESNPFVSGDLRRMVFTVNTPTGDRDLYETTR